MRKVHGLEVLDCACGGKRKVVELVREPEKNRATRERLGLAFAPLKFTRARPPVRSASPSRTFPTSTASTHPAPD
ncbi:MAG TPA: hypothetical protein VGK67_19660 [Myxococcales bacterium]|jgi:hypothetical protein